MWPEIAEELVREQETLGRSTPALWQPSAEAPVVIGGCFVCFRRLAPDRDAGFAAAASLRDLGPFATSVCSGETCAPYVRGLLALREGRLLEAAVRSLDVLPDVLLVNAAGRDHPRRAGLAVHLGAVLGIPTVGVTHRPLLADGAWPGDERGAASPLFLDGEVVGAWLRTRRGARPLAVHAAWRTDPETAVEIVLASLGPWRTPEPLRLARELARAARAQSAA